MELLIATNNAHKVEEFRQIWQRPLKTPRDLSIDFDCDETGNSYFANAQLKALAFRAALARSGRDPDQFVVLADDSGLMVDHLNGDPGIYSARFGGPGRTDAQRNALLLEKLEGAADRSAHYVCCLVAYWTAHNWAAAEETWFGSIATTSSAGRTGFGYDPIFWLPDRGCTVADLAPAEKMYASHRGKACARLVGVVNSLLDKKG